MKKALIAILLACTMFAANIVPVAAAIDANTSRSEIATLDLSLSPEETLNRGFTIINGNIHDRYGNLFLVLDEYGRDPYGVKLCYSFQILYTQDQQDVPMARTVVFDGWTLVRHNVTGHDSVQVGSTFWRPAAHRNVNLRFWSTTNQAIHGMNFAVDHLVGNNWVTISWIMVSRGNSGSIPVGTTNNALRARISGQGGGGDVDLTIWTS